MTEVVVRGSGAVVLVDDDEIEILIARKNHARSRLRNALLTFQAGSAFLAHMDEVKALRQRMPELVLLDLRMPEMDGFTVVERLRADPQLLEQAVINLLRNAADAVAGVEQPQIEVFCERQGSGVVLTISDNGCGVPENRRDQIFVPFFTTKSGGSGIGLNLARQVVLAHNGQIDVQPNVPHGSVFTLTLPSAQPG